MRQLLIVFFLSIVLGFAGDSTNVYICTGPKSECYHKTSSCKGLNRCTGDIRRITLEEAVKMGRRPCKICY